MKLDGKEGKEEDVEEEEETEICVDVDPMRGFLYRAGWWMQFGWRKRGIEDC